MLKHGKPLTPSAGSHSKREMYRGKESREEKEDTCAVCLTGKQHKLVSEVRKAWRAKVVLELVERDICSTIRTEFDKVQATFYCLLMIFPKNVGLL
jgi:hypothetical protein